jgi:hypothetical protein
VGTPTRERTRPWLVALFGVYVVLLVWLVLWKLDVPWVGSGARRTVKLVPFGVYLCSRRAGRGGGRGRASSGWPYS